MSAANDTTPKASPRPTFFAAIQVARIVQQFRKLLKARIKSRAQLSKDQCQAFNNLSFDSFGGHMKSQATQGRIHQQPALRRKNGRVQGKHAKPFLLLKHLDCHPTYGGKCLSHIAQHDKLFLQRKVKSRVKKKPIKDVSHILDLTTLLLHPLYYTPPKGPARKRRASADFGTKLEKFIANLEHLLKCLQQTALDALIYYAKELLRHEVNDDVYWQPRKTKDEDWQPRKPKDEDWFTEWPNGRRPLSTTWPWNIKPSLVVLWGVCWMFYESPPKGHRPGQGPAPQGNWSTPPFSAQPAFHETSGLIPEHYSRNRGQSSQPGHVHGATNLYQNNFIGQIGVGAKLSAPPQGNQHRSMQVCGPSGDPSYIAQNASSSDLPLTTSTTLWPYIQSPQRTINEISHNDCRPRQPVQDQSSISPGTASHLPYSSVPLASTASLYVTAQYQNPFTPNENFDWPPWSFPAPVPPATNLAVPMPGSQGYPSPHSEGFPRESSVCSVMPQNLSPVPNQQGTSPNTDIDHSPTSRRTSTGNDPPRNAQNQMTCVHTECAAAPPVFTRKCEWTKHMDKHTRPHICQEPGCDKIQGFTYSGGLLRHQREVHGQHGGPKAPRMCPHRDCKRSTGVGFSRKENLNEHLRRVHRGIGVEEDEDRKPSVERIGARGSAASVGGDGDVVQCYGVQGQRVQHQVQNHGGEMQLQRKRRREDVDVDEEESSLLVQIKRLKGDVEARDQKIQMLEDFIKHIMGSGSRSQGSFTTK